MLNIFSSLWLDLRLGMQLFLYLISFYQILRFFFSHGCLWTLFLWRFILFNKKGSFRHLLNYSLSFFKFWNFFLSHNEVRLLIIKSLRQGNAAKPIFNLLKNLWIIDWLVLMNYSWKRIVLSTLLSKYVVINSMLL